MFISHKYKSIFIHIQKTGGNSVEDVFKSKDRKLIRRIEIAPENLRTKHCYISDIENVIDKEVFKNYTKFCIVRNPFDRLVSWYSMFKHQTGVKNTVMEAVNEHCSSFKDFIMLPNEGLFRRFYVNQFDYITVDDKIGVDEILRFESLEKDFNTFKKKVNLKTSLPHKNKSIREESYRKYFNDTLKEIVYNRFQKDFDFFSYSF